MKKLLIMSLVFFFMTACQQKETTPEGVKVENETDNNADTKTATSKDVVAIKACSKEARQCPDGRTIGRDPKNNCEFPACNPKPIKKIPLMCTADAKECPDGSFVSRDPHNKCKFKQCPPTKNGRDKD